MPANKKRLAFLIALLICVFVNFVLVTVRDFSSHRGKRTIGRQTAGGRIPARPQPISAINNPVDAFSNLEKEFDLKHAPYVDQRIVEGLKNAMEAYARLFPIRPEQEGAARGAAGPNQKDAITVSIEVTRSIEQLDLERYKIAYHVTLGSITKDYEIILSTDGEKMTENLAEAAKVFAEFSKDFPNDIRFFDLVQQYESEKIAEADRLIAQLGDAHLFEALRLIEEEAGPERVDPRFFERASEVFSWLLFMNSYDANGLKSKLFQS